nr:immunoglobulin light chain junction region [Macaca mulatta]
LLQGYSTPFTF